MTDAETFLKLVKDSIDKFGTSITLKQKSAGEYDPETGDLASTEVLEDVKAIIEDYGQYFIDGNLIKANDKKLTISSELKPKQGDEVIIGNESFNVIHVKAEYFRAAPIIYTLQIRR